MGRLDTYSLCVLDGGYALFFNFCSVRELKKFGAAPSLGFPEGSGRRDRPLLGDRWAGGRAARHGGGGFAEANPETHGHGGEALLKQSPPPMSNVQKHFTFFP